MASPAYVLGVLDALTKAGEVSPAYAAGVMHGLEKSAGLFWDTSHDAVARASAEWQRANPGVQMPPDVARRIMAERGHNWHDSNDAGTWDWLKNRIGKLRSYTPWGGAKTPAMYDRELQAMRNKVALGRINQWARDGKVLDPMMAGALQDAYMRDAGFVSQDARKYMTSAARDRAGYGDGYADKFRTATGDVAANSGYYKPQFFKKNTPDPAKPAYGQGLPKQFGANKGLFYKRDYFDPTAI